MSRLPPLPLIDQEPLNQPLDPLEIPNMGTATFEMTEPNTTLDLIPPRRHWKNPPRDQLCVGKRIIAEKALLMAKLQNEPKKQKEIDTLLGLTIAAAPRKNITMTIDLNEASQKEWNCEKIISRTIYAKNNPIGIPQAVTSSFNRFADTVTLLRAMQNADGVNDCYAGRTDSLEKAQEIAQFVFLGEIDQFEKGLSKGLVQRADGSFELTFLQQSLLGMNASPFSDSDKTFYEHEKQAYEQLAQSSKEKPLVIIHPKTLKEYRVVARPIPVAATPCNWLVHMEKILPDCLNGRDASKKANKEADELLESIAKQKFGLLIRQKNWAKLFQIIDTLDLLKGPKMRPWEEIMTRAYLAHLLDLPEVFNCLSSCDRTGGFAMPLVFAMKTWIRSGKPIPRVEGKYCIHAIMKEDSVKELVAAKVHHEVKTSEYSRGEKGLKVNEGNIPNPAYKHILPSRYLNQGKYIGKKGTLTTLNQKIAEISERRLLFTY